MVFKRRDRRSPWTVVREFLWPRGGWRRAFYYVRHRVKRLPDTPEKIARGLWAGVFTTFTPFYGLHFIIAGLIAWAMRGNIIAALIGTFFGNPLTYVPIGVVCLKVGHWLLGTRYDARLEESLVGVFTAAGRELWHNLLSVFTGRGAHWTGLARFYDEVFFPYLIGGILPGIVAATIWYVVSVPVIRAYQNRRRGRLKKKLAEIRHKASIRHDEVP